MARPKTIGSARRLNGLEASTTSLSRSPSTVFARFEDAGDGCLGTNPGSLAKRWTSSATNRGSSRWASIVTACTGACVPDSNRGISWETGVASEYGSTSAIATSGSTERPIRESWTAKSAPQVWQFGAERSLIASHSLQGLRCNGEAHSLQYLAPGGLPLPQKTQWGDMAQDRNSETAIRGKYSAGISRPRVLQIARVHPASGA